MLSNNIGQGTKARAVFLGNWSSKLSGCLPNSSPALSLLLLAHPKGMTGRAAGMRASQGIQRLRGLPEPCPFEEPYFLLEASYISFRNILSISNSGSQGENWVTD